MTLSERAQAKHVDAARALLPSGTQIRAYAVGRGHARLTVGAGVVTVLFVTIFLVALLAGVVLIPGVLLFFYVLFEVRLPRGIAVTDRGTALLARGFWRGRPTKILSLLGPVSLTSRMSTGRVTLPLGDERVTLSHSSFEVLAAATRAPHGDAASAPPANA
jgi:hypothetical protein